MNTVTYSAKGIFDTFYNKASKKFGQNFLFDENINRRIVAAAGDLSGKTVVEIGPGPGGLTLEILKQNIAKLFIIEFDKRWHSVWVELKNHFGDKLEVIEYDALKFDLKSISPNIIISNLPYNISTQLLFKWLPEFDLYEKMILMFQKEVADRIYANPCTKNYGKLSVLCQWKSKVSKVFDLEPGSFSPPPKVRSTVVKFVPFPKEATEQLEFKMMSNLLTDAFMCRRKTVAKSLRKYFQDPVQILENFGYNKNTRAEEISVDDFIKISTLSCE